MRLFIGITLPPHVRRYVAQLRGQLAREHKIVGKWVEKENLHLTIVFIGEVNDKVVRSLERPLSAAVQSVPAFEVTLAGLASLPPRSPQVLAISLTTPPVFRELQNQCAAALATLQLNASAKPPHLTLVRLKGKAPRLDHNKVKSISFSMSKILLIQSQLSSRGPTYKVLHEMPLEHSIPLAKFRPNVAICVINPRTEVLLVWHREHIKHYWQFLQGGITPGETAAQAVRRELKEELGVTQFQLLSLRERVYHYRWPKQLIERGTDLDKQGFIGQEQSLAIVRLPETRPTLHPDSREAAAIRWFSINTFLRAMNPIRRSLGKLVMVELQRLGLTT